MKAVALIRRRVVLAIDTFAEIAVWRVSEPIHHSLHLFKYRLAYVVKNECVLRYDNERVRAIIVISDRMKCPMPF